MKNIIDVHALLKNPDFSTKIQIFFAIKSAGDDFDPYEGNYEYTNLAPITIRGIVRQITSEALVWKQYGLKEVGAVEVVTERKYKKWFETCKQIVIDGDKYTVFKEGTSTRSVIENRPNNLLKVVLLKV